VIVFLFVPTNLWALSSLEYDARLCSASIVVLEADIQKQLRLDTPETQKRWLYQRNSGSLSTLAWLCRRYAALHKLDGLQTRNKIEQLKNKVVAKDWVSVWNDLTALVNLMPLEIKSLKPENASADAIVEGGKIYSTYCSACHSRSTPDAIPPIFSLTEMARDLLAKEFIARMIIGVHGTPEIALQNPLSDADISAMYAYLRQKPPTVNDYPD